MAHLARPDARKPGLRPVQKTEETLKNPLNKPSLPGPLVKHARRIAGAREPIENHTDESRRLRGRRKLEADTASPKRCRRERAGLLGEGRARTCPPRILLTATVVRGVDRRSSTTPDQSVAIACNVRDGANGHNYPSIPPIRIVLTAHIPLVA